jgi:ribosome recycling factor
VRRDGMETVKGWEKDKKAEASQDDVKRWSDEVQKMTDAHIKAIDAALAEKEKDIKTS